MTPTMAARAFICCLLLSFCCLTISTWVSFDATPSTIHLGLTRMLTLRCGVHRNTSPGSGNYTDSSTSVNITHVMSIVISRWNSTTNQNDTIGNVTPFGDLDITQPEDRFYAEGNAEKSPNPDEVGYLKISWKIPVEEQTGIYICEVFALNRNFHPISIVREVEVNGIDPKPVELAKHIASLQDRVDVLENQTWSRVNVTTLEEKVEALEKELLKLEVKSTTEPIIPSPNFQMGVFECKAGESDVHIEFPKRFHEVPVVFANALYLDATVFEFSSLISVNHCDAHFLCKAQNRGFNVSWIAIGNMYTGPELSPCTE